MRYAGTAQPGGPVRPAQSAQTPRSAGTAGRTAAQSPRAIEWPIARAQIQRVGDTVMDDRDGSGRPHKGIDILAAPGTEVLAARAGTVLRVIDGRQGKTRSLRRAGLFIDVRGSDDLIYRYLHLGATSVQKGDPVNQGAVLGVVAPPFTSGLKDAPHLHFEIRQGDYQRAREDYGPPVDPRRLLPALRS